jgi:hypothetical protein
MQRWKKGAGDVRKWAGDGLEIARNVKGKSNNGFG